MDEGQDTNVIKTIIVSTYFLETYLGLLGRGVFLVKITNETVISSVISVGKLASLPRTSQVCAGSLI